MNKEKAKVELSPEQAAFLREHGEVIRAIPIRWFVRTSDRYWGVGDSIKGAFENACVRFETRGITISAVTPDWQVDDLGGLTDPLGIHDNKEGEILAIRDFVSPEHILGLAGDILKALGEERLSERVNKAAYDHFEDIKGDPPTWITLKDSKGRTVI